MELIRPVDWISDEKFVVDGLEFGGDLASYAERTTEDRVVILKNASLLRQYLDFFKPHCIKNLFEFGIWQGGSPLFYGLATDAQKIVAVDIAAPPPALDKIVKKHRLGDKVKLYFHTSQDDRAAVTTISSAHSRSFGDTPIDLVIDDASHQYEFTRRAFEIVYPRLRPRRAVHHRGLALGAYLQPALPERRRVWQRAGAHQSHLRADGRLWRSPRFVLEHRRARLWFVAIQKWIDQPLPPDFKLDDLLRMRGKKLKADKSVEGATRKSKTRGRGPAPAIFVFAAGSAEKAAVDAGDALQEDRRAASLSMTYGVS